MISIYCCFLSCWPLLIAVGFLLYSGALEGHVCGCKNIHEVLSELDEITFRTNWLSFWGQCEPENSSDHIHSLRILADLGVFMVITRVVFLGSIYGHLVESELCINSGLAECYTAGVLLEFCTVWSMHVPACFTPWMEAVFSPQQAPSSCQGCELSVLIIYNQKQQKPTSNFVNYAISCGGKWSQTVCIFLVI